VNRRFALALAVVALLVVSAGCLTYINDGGEVANETLDAEPPQAYDFATDRDTAINLSTGTRYTAVYNVSGVDEIRFYRQTRTRAISPSSSRRSGISTPTARWLTGASSAPAAARSIAPRRDVGPVRRRDGRRTNGHLGVRVAPSIHHAHLHRGIVRGDAPARVQHRHADRRARRRAVTRSRRSTAAIRSRGIPSPAGRSWSIVPRDRSARLRGDPRDRRDRRRHRDGLLPATAGGASRATPGRWVSACTKTTRTTNSSPSVGNFAFGLAPFSVRDALCGYGRRNCHRRGRTPRR